MLQHKGFGFVRLVDSWTAYMGSAQVRFGMFYTEDGTYVNLRLDEVMVLS